MKAVSIISLLGVFTLFANESLQSQQRPLPLAVTYDRAILTRSYVLQIQNSSSETLDLWLQAKGSIHPFLLPAGKMIKFGWAQNYHFDARNHFLIGGNGFDTIKDSMPNVELSPMRIEHRKSVGFDLSFSQYYVQKKAKDFNFPIRQSFSSIRIEINQVPQMELKEGSNRMFAHCILEGWVSDVKIPVPILATLSFIPEYIPATGKLVASQIQIERIPSGIFAQQDVDNATALINAFLPELFSNYVLYTVPKALLPFAKLFRVQEARVNDGRLELSIF